MKTGKVLQVLQVVQTVLADLFVLVRYQSVIAAAEITVGFILLEDDAIPVHIYFQHILWIDIQRTAKLDRKHNTSQGIQLPNHTCRLHVYDPFHRSDKVHYQAQYKECKQGVSSYKR